MKALNDLIQTKLKLPNDAVVYRRNCPEWDARSVNFSGEIRKNLKIIKPDAVYHFKKQPFILFFDFTQKRDEERASIIQKQIWCFDKAPIVFFIFDNEIKIYNAFRYQKRYDQVSGLEEICFENEEEKYTRFSFWELQSGNTWRWIQETFYKEGKRSTANLDRVNQKLFENIKDLRKKLTNNTPQNPSPLTDTFANILILRLIFIRYLIDRGVEIDEQFIQGKTLENRKQCLNRLIADKQKLQSFFQYLGKRFNGNLFDAKQDLQIDQVHLRELSRIFSDYKDQPFLFDVFDFSIIPVEVISGIYESVIDPEKREKDSAIYTPSFLVDYILSETVEQFLENKQKSKRECKILDPSCGSGIFLVQAYRKLVERNRDKTNHISDKRLVELMQHNLFGIDKDPNALNVAAFSLYVALLDYKEPPEITKFELPKLIDTNLFKANFFDEEASFNFKDTFKNKQFDFILGNPPWKSKKKDKQHLQYIEKHKVPTSGFQIAQTFLVRTRDFSNSDTRCALIVTSKAFYNLWAVKEANLTLTEHSLSNLQKVDIPSEVFEKLVTLKNQEYPNKRKFLKALEATIGKEYRVSYESLILDYTTKGFKHYFFSRFYVDSLFDLSAVRRSPFEESNNPALIIFYRYAFGKNTAGNVVKHFSVKPNFYLQYFKSLVIEKQDQKKILQKYFIEYDWMLKVALYGNTIDFHFLRKLISQPRNIKSFIENLTDIYKGDGIKKLTQNAISKLSPKQQANITPFREIMNTPILETEDICEYYTVVDKGNLPQKGDLYVKSGRHEEFYRGERILLKARPKDETRIVASYIDTDCVYREKVLGIATKTKIDELKVLYGLFNSKLYTYYQFLTSCSWGIFYPEIMQQEYVMFPYAEIPDKKHFLSVVNQFIAYYKEYFLQNTKYQDIPIPTTLLEQINEMVEEAYELNDIEKDLMDYVWEIARYQFQEGRIQNLIKPPSDKNLREYANIFYNHFSNIYNEGEEYFQIEIYRMSYFVAMKFNIVATPPEPDKIITFPKHRYTEETLLQSLAQRLSIYESSNNIFLQKDVKDFEEDFFYIIKPKEYKCWHRAIAHYDLAEFIEEIEKAESDQMMELFNG